MSNALVAHQKFELNQPNFGKLQVGTETIKAVLKKKL